MRRMVLLGAFGSLGALGCSGSDPAQPGGQGGAAGESQGQAGGGAAPQGGSANGGIAEGGGTTAGTGTGGSVSTAGRGGSANTAGSAGTSTGGTDACGAPPTTEAPTPTSCDAAPTGSPALPATALQTVNELRSKMGLPCMALISEINTSSQKHCDYYQQNIEDDACTANAHGEVATCPGYVDDSFAQRMKKAGYQGSPRSEVMAFSGAPERAIAQWINSVYHRTPLLSPWIADMGYGSTADCDTIDMGQGVMAPDSLTAVYPYPNQEDVPISFDGSHEGPMPPEPPSGWPSASPIHLYVKSFNVQSHEVLVSETCAPLVHQWLPDKDYYILYPDEPFAKGTKYRVRIAGTKGNQPLSFDWTFTTAK